MVLSYSSFTKKKRHLVYY